MITIDRVNQLLSYDATSGILTWIKSRGTVKNGTSVSHTNGRGYVAIGIDYESHLVHRIAWMLFYGEIPVGEIDHINGVKTDNRISNLRLATRSINTFNISQRKDNSSGYVGVRWHPNDKRYSATISKNKKRFYLGYFKDFESAVAARKSKEAELFGDTNIRRMAAELRKP